MARADQQGSREGIFSYRVSLFVFGAVFSYFAARDFVWSGGISAIGILCALPGIVFFGLSFFGGEAIIRSLFKRRLVPENATQDD